MKKKLLTPVLIAAGSIALGIGSTFALFTSNESSKAELEAGVVKVNFENTVTKALSRYNDDTPYDAMAHAGDGNLAVFENGGTASIVSTTGDSTKLVLDRISPMDMVSFKATATNASNINIKFRYFVKLEGELLPALQVKIDGTEYATPTNGKTIYSLWSQAMTSDVESLFVKDVSVYFPYEASVGVDQNSFQGKQCSIEIGIEAIQGNATVVNEISEDPSPASETIHSPDPTGENKTVVMPSSNGEWTAIVGGGAVDNNPETELSYTFLLREEPEAVIEDGQECESYDVSFTGIKEGNTEPITITRRIGAGKQNVKVYHNGELIPSQYDEVTGYVTFTVTNFSPFDFVWDAPLTVVVSNKQDLLNYSRAWNLGLETRPLELAADIDMAGIDWECLGNYKYPYSGEINGNGYTIKNLSVTEGVFSEEGEYIAGFVGIVGSSSEHNQLIISDLNFENASINLPTNGSNCGVVVGFAPSTVNFDSYGAGVGADNYQCDNIIVKNCNITGEVIDLKSAGGVMGKAYTTGRIEIVDNNVDVNVTVGKNHIAEIVGYANGLESMLITGNTIAGQLNIPAGDQLADDEVVVGTFWESYLVHSNTSTTKLLLDGTEIDDPVQITYLFEEDGSLAKMDVVWDGSDLQKNAIVAIHGSDKFTLTLKNSGSSNNAAIMSALATDNTNVVLENFQTTGNVSVPNLVLKGNCKISNSYTTAKKTLLCEGGDFKNVTIDANGSAVMTGGKITTFTANQGASITLNGCEAGTNITLSKGSFLTTGDAFVPSTVDNYTVKVHVNANTGTTMVNGVACQTSGGTDLYFLAE